MIKHSPDTFEQCIIAWGQARPDVRVLLITSTRAIPGGVVDVLSDYDIILVTEDITPYHASRDWLSAFGTVLALFRDPITAEFGSPSSGYVIQFEERLKIDFTLWTPAALRHIAALPTLPDELDAGYRVLLDKDGLTDGLAAPSYKAYIPQKPNAEQYHDCVETFFLDCIYVAKYIWRGDLNAAHRVLNEFAKQEELRFMLEWHIEIAHDWQLKPGPFMRRIEQYLRADLLEELSQTYNGVEPEALWDSLYRTCDLMRKAALEVGEHLGFDYPESIEQKAFSYIAEIRQMER
ncbi:MAG: aminoglycoside 6-adenylyltransferase [Anaerolineae bacterium]|jgi:aminoglycoside 6-adenylyltransferase|nr:aminoglycoside 6-adenylyltransferase [Anaerolineae bacterium]